MYIKWELHPLDLYRFGNADIHFFNRNILSQFLSVFNSPIFGGISRIYYFLHLFLE